MIRDLWCCPRCGAPRTHDRLDGSPAFYCACPGFGAGASDGPALRSGGRSPLEERLRDAEREAREAREAWGAANRETAAALEQRVDLEKIRELVNAEHQALRSWAGALASTSAVAHDWTTYHEGLLRFRDWKVFDLRPRGGDGDD